MSNQSFDDLERLFKEKIEEYRESPSDKTWQELESKLDRNPYGAGKESSHSNKWALLAILCIISVVGCFVYFHASVNVEYTQANGYKAIQNQIIGPVPGNAAWPKKKSDKEVTASENQKNKEAAEGDDVAEFGIEELNRKASGLGRDAIKVEEREPEDNSKHSVKVNALPARKRKVILYSQAGKRRKALTISSEKHAENKKGNANGQALTEGTMAFEKQSEKRHVDSLGGEKEDALKPLTQQDIPGQIEKADSVDAFSKDKTLPADSLEGKSAFEPKDLGFKPYFSIVAVYAPNEINNKLEQGVQRYEEDDKDVIRQQETIKSSYAYGILAEYKFREHWAIQSGLKVSSTTTSIHSKHIFARPDLANISSILSYKYNSSAGFASIPNVTAVLLALGDSVKTLPSESNITYAVVPVALQYSTSFGRLSFVGSAGVNINYLTRATLDTELDIFGFRLARTYKIQGLRKSYFSGSLGLGIGYSVSDRISMFFLPTQTFSFGPVNEQTPVKKYERTIGYQALLRYRL